jgi:bacteriocin biosynthesis cyclodehydratase domain-containing protein
VLNENSVKPSNYKIYLGDDLREYFTLYFTQFYTPPDKPTRRFRYRRSQTQGGLEDASITLLGLGPVGRHVLLSLAPLGLKKIRVVDYHLVTSEETDFRFFGEDDVGKQRCTIYQRLISKLTDERRFEWRPLQLDSVTGEVLNADLVIHCPEEANSSALAHINEVCLQHDQPWLSARVNTSFAEVGPTILPHRGPCFRCYESRLESNKDGWGAPYFLDPRPSTLKLPPITTELFSRLTAEYVSLEVIKLLTNNPPMTLGGVLFLDFVTGVNRFHRVLKLPNCPACHLPVQRDPSSY